MIPLPLLYSLIRRVIPLVEYKLLYIVFSQSRLSAELSQDL